MNLTAILAADDPYLGKAPRPPEGPAYVPPGDYHAIGRCNWCHARLVEGTCPVRCRIEGSGHERVRWTPSPCLRCGTMTTDYVLAGGVYPIARSQWGFEYHWPICASCRTSPVACKVAA
jgi:hypothetical protein